MKRVKDKKESRRSFAKVFFIGAGPGDPGLLTVKGRETIHQAGLVVYAGSLINKEILSYADEDSRRVDSSPLSLDQITSLMITEAKKGVPVARIHSGDPSMYGAIAEQMSILEKEKIPCEIIPGVSSAFAAAAALKVEYTLPGKTQTLILTRRAGRTPVPERESLQLLAGHGSSMAIFLSIGMIDDTVKELIAGGYPVTTPVAVVYRATWPDEKRIKGTLVTIAEKVKKKRITRQALILVGDAVGRFGGEPSKLYAPDFIHGYRKKKNVERKGTAIIALTRRGWHTGRKILHAIDEATLFLPGRFNVEVKGPRVFFFEQVRTEAEKLFPTYERLIFIMATGIAVRIVAPLVKSKWEDPAIVTMDDGGRNIISLLSGHWGGANDLTLKLSHILGGNPVITTESDVMGFPSIDTIIKVLTDGKVPKKKSLIKNIQTAILEDEDVGFYPKELCLLPGMEGHPNLHFFDSIEALVCSRCTAGLIVSNKTSHAEHTQGSLLLVRPHDLVVGIGCHKGVTSKEIDQGVNAVFHDRDLSQASIAAVCSTDRKKNEKGLIQYAHENKFPLKFFTTDEINNVIVPSPASKHSMEKLGIHGVAEPCALLGTSGGKLLVNKVKLPHMTVAVANIPIKNLVDSSKELYDD